MELAKLATLTLLPSFHPQGFAVEGGPRQDRHDAAEEPVRHLHGPVRQPAARCPGGPTRLHGRGSEPGGDPVHPGAVRQQGPVGGQREAAGAAGN